MKNIKKMNKLIPALIVGGIGLTVGSYQLIKKYKNKNSENNNGLDPLTELKIECLEEFIDIENEQISDLEEIIIRKFIDSIKSKELKANIENLEILVNQNDFTIFSVFSENNFARIFEILTLN